MATDEVRAESDDGDGEVIELEIVGESYRQEALAGIAGPKEPDGKLERVGVSLRCDPQNPYDANAIRVEVMGQHVAFVSRSQAAVLAPAITTTCRGVLEARGMIVGGWLDRSGGVVSEGHYGIRVWLTQRDAQRLGIRADDLVEKPPQPWPDPPALATNERRMSPTEADCEAQRFGSSVTVTCEEHYQAAIEAAMPAGWNSARSWPLLVDLVMAESNPHRHAARPCVEVRHGASTIGYLTPKMTDRYTEAITSCVSAGQRATAMAITSKDTKARTVIWQVTVTLLT